MQYICEVDNFSIQRANIELFQPLSFTLLYGQCLEITGDNGIGKTSLLESFFDNSIAKLGTAKYTETPFYLSAKPPIDNKITVNRNIIFWSNLYNADQNIINDAINYWHIKALLDMPIANLSLGQLQRLNLMRLSIVKNKFLLIDEPTISLDQKSEKLFCIFIAKLLQNNRSVLLTTNKGLSIGKTITLQFSNRVIQQ